MTTATTSPARLSSRAAPFVMRSEANKSRVAAVTAETPAEESKQQPPPPPNSSSAEPPQVTPPPQRTESSDAEERKEAAERPSSAPTPRSKKRAKKATKHAALRLPKTITAAQPLSLHAAAGAPTSTTPLPPASSNSPVTVRLLLGKNTAGVLIGHRGAGIDSIRQQSVAALADLSSCSQPFLAELDDLRSHQRPRIATMKGALVQVQRSLECILAVLMEKREQSAARALKRKMAEVGPNDRPPTVKQPTGQVCLTFIIPNTQLGALIGVRGETIAAVRERSAATLRVSEENLERSEEKSLRISGHRTQVQYAACAITELLCQAQLAGMPFSPQPFVLNAPPQPGQQAALAALAAPVPAQPHPNAQQPVSPAQQPMQPPTPAATLPPMQAQVQPPMQPSMQPLVPPLGAPPVLISMHPPMFNPLVAQLHEVTMRLQQLGIQSAHQSLYGLVNQRQLQANQMEIHQLQHIYQMLQAQLHQQTMAHMPPLMQQPPYLPMHHPQYSPAMPAPIFRASPAGPVGAMLDRSPNTRGGGRNNRVTRQFFVPQSLMGGLIGKQGSRIQAVREQSEAKIKICTVEQAMQLQTPRPVECNRRSAAPVAPLPEPSPPAADAGDRKEDSESDEEDPSDKSLAENPSASPSDSAGPTSDDCVLILSGTRRQVEMAAQLILELVEFLQQKQPQATHTSTHSSTQQLQHLMQQQKQPQQQAERPADPQPHSPQPEQQPPEQSLPQQPQVQHAASPQLPPRPAPSATPVSSR